MKVRKRVGLFFRRSKKFFRWMFTDKSLASHVVFLAFAYIVLKFVLFPGFLALTGLNDVVAVLSGSMHHQPGVIDGTFNDWLLFNDFNESDFSEWPFINGLDMGDAVTVVPGEIMVGDIIVYYHESKMIIHRVVNITYDEGLPYYTTKGDANPKSMDFEIAVPTSRVVGKVGVRVPWLGWPRTILYYLIGM